MAETAPELAAELREILALGDDPNTALGKIGKVLRPYLEAQDRSALPDLEEPTLLLEAGTRVRLKLAGAFGFGETEKLGHILEMGEGVAAVKFDDASESIVDTAELTPIAP